MTPQTKETHSLLAHVERLKFAVATTTCRETRSVLQKMLSDAKARLQRTERVTSSHPKMH